MKKLIFIISLLFASSLFSQNKSGIDTVKSTIIIHFNDKMDENTLTVSNLLKDKNVKKCNKIILYGLKNSIPANFFDFKWVKIIEAYGTFDVEQGDSVVPNLEVSDKFNTLTNLRELKFYSVGLKGFNKKFCSKSIEQITVHQDALTIIPKEILNCKNLKYLSIQRNNLTTIPNEISRLSKLEYLVLDINSIQKIPVGLCKIKTLKSIILTANNISEIPSEIKNLSNLEYLELFSNPIKSIPSEVKELKKLKVFGIDIKGGWGT